MSLVSYGVVPIAYSLRHIRTFRCASRIGRVRPDELDSLDFSAFLAMPTIGVFVTSPPTGSVRSPALG